MVSFICYFLAGAIIGFILTFHILDYCYVYIGSNADKHRNLIEYEDDKIIVLSVDYARECDYAMAVIVRKVKEES